MIPISTSIRELYNIPATYADEAEKFQELLFKGNSGAGSRSQSGNTTFISTTSEAVYNTAIGTGIPADDAYINDKGEEGLFYWLGLNSVLGTYIPNATDWNQIRAEVSALNDSVNSLNTGWIPANDIWSYASTTTITVSSGALSRYQKGDKVKLTQSGTVKYFYIVNVTDTLLTVTGGSDYTLANASITDNYYSHSENPRSFPQRFNFVPSWSSLTIGNGTNTGNFQLIGKTLYFKVRFTFGSSSSVSGNITLALPVSIGSYATIAIIGTGSVLAGGQGYPLFINKSGVIYGVTTGSTYGGYISSTTTIPVTWGSGYDMEISGFYEIA